MPHCYGLTTAMVSSSAPHSHSLPPSPTPSWMGGKRIGSADVRKLMGWNNRLIRRGKKKKTKNHQQNTHNHRNAGGSNAKEFLATGWLMPRSSPPRQLPNKSRKWRRTWGPAQIDLGNNGTKRDTSAWWLFFFLLVILNCNLESLSYTLTSKEHTLP